MRPWLFLGALAVGVAGAGGCAPPEPGPSAPANAPGGTADFPVVPRAPAPDPRAGTVRMPRIELGREPFTVVVLPDTQFTAAAFPEIFEAQTRWIAENRDAERIALVVHEGDIVQSPEDPNEWRRALRALSRLDDVVPYALARGNHDLAGGVSRIGGLMDTFFPPARFFRYPWFRETYETGRMSSSFLLVEMGGQTWIVLALDFGASDGALAWAGGILRRYAPLPAIIVTHAYLYDNEARYDHRRRPHQHYSPKDLPLEGGSNDGEEMWEKLVSRHDNVLFVLSGHVTEGGVGRMTSTRPSGTRVHEILANYQIHGRGGDGFLRVMRFDPVERRVAVQTYSPYLHAFKTDPGNQFLIELD